MIGDFNLAGGYKWFRQAVERSNGVVSEVEVWEVFKAVLNGYAKLRLDPWVLPGFGESQAAVIRDVSIIVSEITTAHIEGRAEIVSHAAACGVRPQRVSCVRIVT